MAQQIIDKYPQALSKDYGLILERDQADIQKILDFVVAPSNNDLPYSTSTSTTTDLDDPTWQAKLKLLFGSDNPLMKFYLILPFLAVVAIIIFLAVKKRKI